MKEQMLKIILRFLKFFQKTHWDDATIRILINEKDRTRADILQQKIAEKISYPGVKAIVTRSKLSFLRHINDADFLFSYGLSRYATPVRLKLIYIGQVGITSFKVPASCKVVNTPNFAANHIAEYVVASTFAYERGLVQNRFLQCKRIWNPKYYLEGEIKHISSLKIGIIGLGRIGNQVAEMFQQNNVELHVFDKDAEKTQGFGFSYNETNWREMLQLIDYLVIALSNEQTSDFITSKELSRANPRLCIVNISRGDVINERDLLHALKSGQIRGAILDVFQREPLPKRHPFWKQKGVVITPHIAGNINLVFDKIADDFVANLNAYMDGHF